MPLPRTPTDRPHLHVDLPITRSSTGSRAHPRCSTPWANRSEARFPALSRIGHASDDVVDDGGLVSAAREFVA
jgi:hypothetical protein